MKPSRALTLRLTPAALALLSASAVVCAQEEPVQELPTVQIRAPRMITPLPGVVLDRDQTTVNVQSATAEEIKQQQSLNITDFLNNQGQSVTINA
jgi:outer membrane receptor protein involved in Fe transport